MLLFQVFLTLAPKQVNRDPKLQSRLNALSRSGSARGNSRSLASSGARGFSGREVRRRLLGPEPSLYITKGEPCDLGFEKRNGQTVSLIG